jgi:hypothetical protein
MSIFRSEEHIERWLAETGYHRGEVVAIGRVWELAKAWYVDPRQAGWRPRSKDESQAVLASVGLTSDFWTLPG